MKFLMKKMFILSLVVLSILGFSSFALAATEVEPNNDATKANVIKINEPVTGTFDDALDFDTYSLTIEQGGDLNLKLTPPAGIDGIIEVYDEDLEYLFEINNADTGEVEDDYGPIGPGKYYIVVYDLNSEVSKESYTLETSIEEAANPVLSNVVLAPTTFTNNSKNTLKIQYNVDTDSIIVAIVKDAKGNAISTIEAEKPEGAGFLVWNGLTSTGTTAVSGAYTVTVFAVDSYYANVSELVTKDLTVKKVITKINKKGSAKISNAKVLASPVSSAKAVATLAKSTKFTVLEIDGNWYKVKLANGKIGYIIKSSVTV